MFFKFSFLCIIRSWVWRPYHWTSVHICLGARWRTPPSAGVSGYIEDPFRGFRLLSVVWSDCCRFYTFPISILKCISCILADVKRKDPLWWNETSKTTKDYKWNHTPIVMYSTVNEGHRLLYILHHLTHHLMQFFQYFPKFFLNKWNNYDEIFFYRLPSNQNVENKTTKKRTTYKRIWFE